MSRSNLVGSGLLLCSFSVGCTQQEPVADQTGQTSASSPSTNILQEDSAAEPEMVMNKEEPAAYNKLTEFEEYVILQKGTEHKYVGEYTNTEAAGVYVCRRCNARLYTSEHKFHSNCGWPAFDDEIEGAVNRNVDADGHRIEIVCSNCGGHLGHVFEGEGYTQNNIRHCVNSVSMRFYPADSDIPEVIKLPNENKD